MERMPSLLAGRHSELKDMWEWLSLGSGCLLVEGETGIGKTRLVSEFAEMAGRQGWTVRIGHCYEAPPTVPFLPFLQILTSSRPADGHSRHQVQEDLAGLSEIEAVHANTQPSELRAQFLARVAGRVLELTAGTKTLLVLEDLQWADATSLLLINHLLDIAGLPPLLITVRTPTPGGRGLLSRMRREMPRLTLSGLGEDDLALLARDICGTGTLSPREVSWLFELTAGNPLFATEVLRDLRQSGLLSRLSASEAAHTLGIPDQLTALLDQRIAALSDNARRVLNLASSFQGRIDPELLGHCEGLSFASTREGLSEAAARGLVVPAPEHETGMLAFAHPFVRRLLYERMTSAEMRDTHRKIANACEEAAADFEENDYYAIHLALSSDNDDRDLAVEASITAAERAERLFAFESAIRFWRLAATRVRQRPRRAQLLLRLGQACRAAGDWTAATRSLERAYAIAVDEGLKDLEAEIAYSLGEIFRFRLDLAQASEWLEKSLAVTGRDSSRAIRSLALLGSAYASAGQVEPGRQVLDKALALAAEHEKERPFVAFWAAVGFTAMGDVGRAVPALNDGLEIARADGDRYWAGLLASLRLQGELATLQSGKFEALLADINSLPEPKDAATLAREMVSRTLVLAYQGRWAEVLGAAESWMSQVRLAGKFQVATARLVWGEACYWLGDLAGAETAMRAAVPDLGGEQSLGSLHLARVLLKAGKRDEALDLVRKSQERALASTRAVPARVLLGELACQFGDQSLAARVVTALEQEPRPMAVGYKPLSVRRVLGGLYALLGNWSKAFDAFDHAIAELSHGQANWELVLTYLDHAEAREKRARRGDAAKALASKAEAVRILRDHHLPIAALESRADLSHVPPGARFGLSTREVEVLQLVARGETNGAIGEELGLSMHTIDRHLENIFSKMQVSGRTEAVYQAFREGLIAGVGG